MRNVVYALLPVAAFAVYQFGISVLALLIVTTTLVAMATENLFCRLSGRGQYGERLECRHHRMLLA